MNLRLIRIFAAAAIPLVALSLVANHYYFLYNQEIRSHVQWVFDFAIGRRWEGVPSEGRNRTFGKFYDYSTPSLRFFVYSAIYDDRLSLNSTPLLRLITIGDGINGYKQRNNSAFCLLHHSHGIDRVELESNPITCGPAYGFNGRDALAFVYTCPTIGGRLPHCVDIQFSDRSNNTNTTCMPVDYPKKPEHRKKILICVPISYGNFHPYHLIEWLEMQRILGANLIAVYDLYLGKDSLKVLRHYAEKDTLVEFRKMDMIYPWEQHAHLLDLWVSLNDCLYRHMHEFDRMIISDFDEFIKPHNHTNLPELVDYLERSENKSVNYMIRNNYYLQEFKPDNETSRYLKFLGYRMKAIVSVPFHRVKPIIKIESCTHVFSHICCGLTPAYKKYEINIHVDPSIALNRHYRRCPWDIGFGGCLANMNTSVQDNNMLYYKENLRTRVQEKILSIMGSIPKDFS